MTITEMMAPTDGGTDSFRLDIPNREVARSFVPELFSVKPPLKTLVRETASKNVLDSLLKLDKEGIQRAFGDYLNQFKYNGILEHESFYQSLFEVALEWTGQEIESQHFTSQGILDVLLSGENVRYIVEIKVFKEKRPKLGVQLLPPTDPSDVAALHERMAPKADEALKQIREKYAATFKPVGRVHGIAIVVARRTFVSAKIEKDL